MNIYIIDSYKKYTDFAAKYILQFLENELKEKDKVYISIASEDITKDIYEAITNNLNDFNIDFKRVNIFQQTEYVGVSNDHESSRANFLKRYFLSKIGIPKENVYLFDGSASENQMKRQELLIKSLKKLDMIWYSLNSNAASAGNERISSLSALFRLKTLSEMSLYDASDLFKNHRQFVPTKVFSMGMGFIDMAENILLTASGVERSSALKECIEEGISDNATLSVIQKHKNASVIADFESSLRLSRETISMKI